MSEHSPNLNLNLYSGADGEEKFRSFMEKLAGPSADSNMMLLDAAIKAQAEKLKKTALLDGTGKLPDSLLPEIGAEHIPFVSSSLFQAAVGDASNVSEALENIGKVSADAYAHIENTNNPHGVTAEKINAVPVSRTINGQPLSADITLTPSDIGITGKSACSIVIGTTTAGHTLNDCDYLCDGVDDQVEISQAITDNEQYAYIGITLLSGIYYLSGSIVVHGYSNYIHKCVSIRSVDGCELHQEKYLAKSIHIDNNRDDKNKVEKMLKKLLVENIVFSTNNTGDGVYSNSGTFVVVSKCDFTDIRLAVFSYSGSVTDCTFERCYQTLMTSGNVYNCSIINCAYGAEIRNGGVFLCNTVIHNNNSKYKPIAGVIGYDNHIAFNTIKGYPVSIQVPYLGGSVIQGNKIYIDANTDNCKGIHICGNNATSSENVVVVNNIIFAQNIKSSSYPIYIQKNNSPPSSGTVGTVTKCLIANNISFGKSYYVESGLSQVYFVNNYS